MKKTNKKSTITLYDISTGATLLMFFGIPALIVIGVIAIVFIAVILIKKARKTDQTTESDGEPKNEKPEEQQ